MSYSGQVLDNQVTGERFVFHATSDDTAGQLLEFDLVVEPHGRVPGGHVHPGQQESFEVLEGTMKFRKGLRTVIARPGDLVVVEPGTFHRFANAGTAWVSLGNRGRAPQATRSCHRSHACRASLPPAMRR